MFLYVFFMLNLSRKRTHISRTFELGKELVGVLKRIPRLYLKHIEQQNEKFYTSRTYSTIEFFYRL